MDRWDQWETLPRRPQFSALDSCHTQSAPPESYWKQPLHQRNRNPHGLIVSTRRDADAAGQVESRTFWKWQRSGETCASPPFLTTNTSISSYLYNNESTPLLSFFPPLLSFPHSKRQAPRNLGAATTN
ncbi:hypothetical protein TgHK011_008002 [Trichoderma gracile]|nr:hypothetical protein TgHK011_008002 [Trichoderma gracile]